MATLFFFASTLFKVHATTEVRAHFKGGISDVELFQFFLDSDTDKWLQWFCHGLGTRLKFWKGLDLKCHGHHPVLSASQDRSGDVSLQEYVDYAAMLG